MWPPGGGGAPQGPRAFPGSLPTPQGGLSGHPWVGSQTDSLRPLYKAGTWAPGVTRTGHLGWGSRAGAADRCPLRSGTDLVAQHEPVAVTLGDRVPAHQHAAGGGGQRRHVGGARGGHWGREGPKRMTSGPKVDSTADGSGGVPGAESGARAPNRALPARSPPGSGVLQMLFLCRLGPCSA